MVPLQHHDDAVSSYAHALLAEADQLDQSSYRASLQLPSLRLDIGTDDRDYLAQCRRALIDDASYLGPSLEVTIVNHPKRMDVPQPHPDVAALGLGEIFRRLESVGLRGTFDSVHRIWQVYDPQRRRGVQLAFGDYPPWDVSFPLRNFLHWHYESLGLRLVHGATLGRERGGVLLVGDGGAGKSGTTLGSMLHGLMSVGDDYVLLDLSAVRPQALPVMRLMKQDAAGLARLGYDIVGGSILGPNWQGKYELDLDDQPKGMRARALPIFALVLPRLGGGNISTVSDASTRDAMLALAPSTLRQLPGVMATGLSFMADLVRRVPAFHVQLSTDPAEVAAAIELVIDQVAA